MSLTSSSLSLSSDSSYPFYFLLACKKATRGLTEKKEITICCEDLYQLFSGIISRTPFERPRVFGSNSSTPPVIESERYRYRDPIWKVVDSVLKKRTDPEIFETKEERAIYFQDVLRDCCRYEAVMNLVTDFEKKIKPFNLTVSIEPSRTSVGVVLHSSLADSIDTANEAIKEFIAAIELLPKED